MEEKKSVQAAVGEIMTMDPVFPDTSALGPGGKLYHSHCSVCHGPDGKKKYDEAKDLSVSKLSMEERIHIISAAQIIGNKEHTPRWTPVFSEEEIYLISQYLDSLK